MGSFSIWHWLILIVLVFLIPLYFLPGIIASKRNHPNATVIWLLNIFLGGTLVVWVIALVWAYSSPIKSERQV